MVATVDLRQRQWLLAVAVSGSAREKERKMQRKGEGEWRGQGKTGLMFGFHAPGRGGDGADTGVHAALAVCTVTTLFIKFKFPILPQTYH